MEREYCFLVNLPHSYDVWSIQQNFSISWEHGRMEIRRSTGNRKKKSRKIVHSLVGVGSYPVCMKWNIISSRTFLVIGRLERCRISETCSVSISTYMYTGRWVLMAENLHYD